MKNLILLFLIYLIFSAPVKAATSLCKGSETSTTYCKYIGKDEQIYINSDGLVLIFLEKEIPIDMAKEFGFSITSGKAVVFEVTEKNSYLTSLIHNTVVEALTEKLEIEIHTRSTLKGYMKLDRIWVKESNNIF
jgi:hypothetical protein